MGRVEVQSSITGPATTDPILAPPHLSWLFDRSARAVHQLTVRFVKEAHG